MKKSKKNSTGYENSIRFQGRKKQTTKARFNFHLWEKSVRSKFIEKELSCINNKTHCKNTNQAT